MASRTAAIFQASAVAYLASLPLLPESLLESAMLLPRTPLPALVVLAIAAARRQDSTGVQATTSAPLTGIRGVAPEDARLYAAAKTGEGKWTCLHSGQQIDAAAINDDYCDCEDGSDEPGTSACPNSTFYCLNEGHIPARILSSRVNDGICDPECCDGSDEHDGKVQCPNRCATVGKAYRKQQQEATNVRRAGSKIRDKYISDRVKALSSLTGEVARLEIEVQTATEKEQKAKAALDAAESMDKVVIERKMASPLYNTLKGHQDAIRALLTKQATLKDEVRRLTDLLDDLAKNYNPNYQDMAVKGAVVSYRNWRRGGEASAEEADPKANEVPVDDEPNTKLNELEADPAELPRDKVNDIIEADPLTLMDDDKYKGAGGDDSGILFRIHEYLPDAVVPYFEAAVDTILDLFLRANVITEVKRRTRKAVEGGEAENVTAARTTHRTAANTLREAEQSLKSKRDELDSSPEKWGRHGEFKALDGLKISKNFGEYTYELDFFGSAVQVPNRGHGRVTLGRFERFEPLNDSLTVNDDGFFLRQVYLNGQKCWNGPDRSLILDLECGPENALLDVFEAEKCIYSARATTPAVCMPLEATTTGQNRAANGRVEGVSKDEL